MTITNFRNSVNLILRLYLTEAKKKTACLTDSHLGSDYAENSNIIGYIIQSNNNLTFFIVEEELAPVRSLKIQYPVPVHYNCMEWITVKHV